MTAGDARQCRARTESGDRCSRPAGDDGFCHQHGPDDEPVENEADGDRSNGSTTANDTEQMAEDSDNQSEIERVRETVQGVAEDVVGHPLDGITRIGRDGDEAAWTVAVEVRERKGVPDTQDILGRYELRLDEDLTVTGYERTHRYRRDDMEQNV